MNVEEDHHHQERSTTDRARGTAEIAAKPAAGIGFLRQLNAEIGATIAPTSPVKTELQRLVSGGWSPRQLARFIRPGHPNAGPAAIAQLLPAVPTNPVKPWTPPAPPAPPEPAYFVRRLRITDDEWAAAKAANTPPCRHCGRVLHRRTWTPAVNEQHPECAPTTTEMRTR